MADVITSTANARVKAVRELHRHKARVARRETIIEGPTVFGEFVDAGVVPSLVLCTPDDTATIERCVALRLEPLVVTGDVLSSASDTRAPRSPVAVVPIPDTDELRRHNTLVLVDISDPGNVGTMIRTAAALGWDVAVSGATAEIWSPKTVRSGAGAHVHTRLIALDESVPAVSAAGLTSVATVVAGGEPPQGHREPVAVLIGSEAHGLPAGAADQCDERVTIEMPGGMESLNAAVAAAIMMYALAATVPGRGNS